MCVEEGGLTYRAGTTDFHHWVAKGLDSTAHLIPSDLHEHTGSLVVAAVSHQSRDLVDVFTLVLKTQIGKQLTLILLSTFISFFQPLELVSRYRDPQPQVVEN